jgi:hypothetical protein
MVPITITITMRESPGAHPPRGSELARLPRRAPIVRRDFLDDQLQRYRW